MHSSDPIWHQQMMAIWIIVIVLAVLLALFFWRGKANTDAAEDAEEVLKRRYARGEIDEETYKRMLEELRK